MHKNLIYCIVSLLIVMFSCRNSRDRVIDLEKVDADKLPYKLIQTEIYITQLEQNTVSIHADSSDWILMSHLKGRGKDQADNNTIILKTFSDQSRFVVPFYNQVYFKGTLDFDRDGFQELCISEHKRDTTLLHIYRLDETKIQTLTVATNPRRTTRPWECEVELAGLMDVNHDGCEDLIVNVITQDAYQPRGIYAFDWRKDRCLWKYESGFKSNHVQLADFEGDGFRDIIMGSNAANNCEGAFGKDCIINGTDDRRTYFAVLDSLGTEKILIPITGPNTNIRAYAHDINGDNSKEIMIERDIGNGRSLYLWDPVSKSFHNILTREGKKLKTVEFYDINQDDIDDICIGWYDGCIEIYDHTGHVLQSVRIEDFNLLYCIQSDLNRDGHIELIVSGLIGDEKVILIFDSFLDLLTFRRKIESFPTSPSAVFDPKRNEDKMLLLQNQNVCFALKLEKQSRWMFIKSHLYSIFPAVLFISITLGSVYLAVLIAVHASIRNTLSNFLDTQEHAYCLLDMKEKIIHFNHAWKELFQWKQNGIRGLDIHHMPKFETVFKGSIKKLLKGNSSFYEKTINYKSNGNNTHFLFRAYCITYPFLFSGTLVLLLQDLNDKYRVQRALSWAGMAQKLAHEVKTPLSTITLTAQRIKKMDLKENSTNGNSTQYFQHIFEQVARIRNLTDALLQYDHVENQHAEKLNVNDVIQETLYNMKLTIPAHVQIDIALQDHLPKITADKGQLKIVIGNLITNCLDAVGNEGYILVATRLVQHITGSGNGYPQEIEIEIADNGPGIQQQFMDRLFEPFFSMKKGGTGIGLFVVKEIVERMKGSIQINSKENIGTTVFLRIPAEEE